MKKIYLSLLFVLLISLTSASAQDSAIDPAALLKNMPNLSTQVFKGMFADLTKQPPKSANKTQNNNVKTKSQTLTEKNQPSTIINPVGNEVTAGKTTFTPTGSFLLLKEFAKRISKNEGEIKKAEEYLIFHYNDYNDLVKKRGWTPNDVARSASSVLISCINMYHDRDVLSQAQREGIYRQSKERFETDEAFQATTNADKQKAYELNVMLWSMIGTYYILAKEKNDPKVIKAVGDAAAVMFEYYTGQTIEELKITDNGLKF